MHFQRSLLLYLEIAQAREELPPPEIQTAIAELRRRLEALEEDGPPFAPRPAGIKGAHWVRPHLVAEVKFMEWTPDGRLRHPSFQGLREDKKAGEVVREKAVAPSPAASRKAAATPPAKRGRKTARARRPVVS